MVFRDINGDKQPSNVTLLHYLSWVHIFNLPLNCHDHDSLVKDGTKIGRVIEINPIDINSWGKYARVRVHVDVTLPLK